MAENTKPKTRKVVRYVGAADVREIDAKSWSTVEADGQSKVVWDSRNRKTVDASDLNAGALKYLEGDKDFVVEEVEV